MGLFTTEIDTVKTSAENDNEIKRNIFNLKIFVVLVLFIISIFIIFFQNLMDARSYNSVHLTLIFYSPCLYILFSSYCKDYYNLLGCYLVWANMVLSCLFVNTSYDILENNIELFMEAIPMVQIFSLC
jgi:hypothetical protein